MNYFKSESAHILNRLMGTTGESFWCSGYDSPLILSANKFLERMLYLYMNPVKAGSCLETKNYSGISTYNNLISGDSAEVCKRVPRNEVSELPQGPLSRDFDETLSQRFWSGRGKMYPLQVKPWAWFKCFPESKDSLFATFSTCIYPDSRRMRKTR